MDQVGEATGLVPVLLLLAVFNGSFSLSGRPEGLRGPVLELHATLSETITTRQHLTCGFIAHILVIFTIMETSN